MQIRSGSLLIAHPAHARAHRTNSVVFITESNNYSTLGLTLNAVSNYDLRELMTQHDIDWQGADTLYMGGSYNSTALVMLHSNEWYSSNTMSVDQQFSISSDQLMMEKMSMGNAPDWYQLFIGCEAWDADDLEHQLRSKNPKWLLLSRPSQALIELADEHLWQNAVEEYSQDVFSNYI